MSDKVLQDMFPFLHEAISREFTARKWTSWRADFFFTGLVNLHPVVEVCRMEATLKEGQPCEELIFLIDRCMPA